MKFRLFVEGETEDEGVGAFLSRWLNRPEDGFSQKIGISTRRFKGCSRLWQDTSKAAIAELTDTKAHDLIGVISLLDLASDLPFLSDIKSGAQRDKWGKEYLERSVGIENYKHFFVHYEVEAWLLSQLSLFPEEVRTRLKNESENPDKVNHDRPPSKRIIEAYVKAKIGKYFSKRIDGQKLFAKLDPEIAYAKCPSLRAILDEMLLMARAASL